MEMSSCTLFLSSLAVALVLALTSPVWVPIFLKIRINADDLFPSVQPRWQPIMAMATVLFLLFTALPTKTIKVTTCGHPQVVACR